VCLPLYIDHLANFPMVRAFLGTGSVMIGVTWFILDLSFYTIKILTMCAARDLLKL
jgi:hypothetical protein